uniref:Uncharacterized protein n=1 Tax=Rhizophora mucronata TaxID=61149 RepID=A0A2P2NW36_RHIMU
MALSIFPCMSTTRLVGVCRI